MPIPSPSDDEILAKLNANDRAGGRLALVLLSTVLVLVAIYAAAYFTGEVTLVQSQAAQIAIGGLFAMVLVFVFAGFGRHFRPVAPSDASDPRIVRRRIDAHHRQWRWMLVSWLTMTFGFLPLVTVAGRALGDVHSLLAVATAAVMIAPIVLFSLLMIAGPGWGNRELRAILNDEFVRQLRVRTMQLGYFTMGTAVSAGILATVWRPDLALLALWWSLYAGFAVPALYYVIADWRAGRDG